MQTWQLAHFVDELRLAGNSVCHVNPAATAGGQSDMARNSQLVIDAASNRQGSPFDLFFAIAHDDELERAAIREIARAMPTVLMCCDDQSVPFSYRTIAPHFDLVWTTSHEGDAILRKRYGATTVMMPYAANPSRFRPHAVPLEDRAVCFVGRSYGARVAHLTTLSKAGLTTRLYGTHPETLYGGPTKATTPLSRALTGGTRILKYAASSATFPIGRRCLAGALSRTFDEAFGDPIGRRTLGADVECHPGPTFDDMGRIFSQNAVSLGSMELHSTFALKHPVMCVHLREFEAPMCGAVHITNRCSEIQDYYEEDREILCYGSREELVEKVRDILSPRLDAFRASVRKAARARGLGDHTWTHRFETVAARLGIQPPLARHVDT